MREVWQQTPQLALLMTLPGVGFIRGMAILLEVGDVHRFPDAEHLAGYAGTTRASMRAAALCLALELT